MAGQSNDEIVVAGNGQIYSAPLGTTEPGDIDATLSAAWVDLGYASDEGVRFVDGKTLENIPVWQSFYPARKIVTERDANLVFVLRQWNRANVELAFGGDVSSQGGGKYLFSPPDPEVVDERMLAVAWQDGDKNYRLIIPRGMVTENVETQLFRTGPSDLPITFGVIGEAGSLPWYLQTDDPAFESPGS